MIGEPLIFVGTSDLAGLVRGKAFPAADAPVSATPWPALSGLWITCLLSPPTAALESTWKPA